MQSANANRSRRAALAHRNYRDKYVALTPDGIANVGNTDERAGTVRAYGRNIFISTIGVGREIQRRLLETGRQGRAYCL
jgi:hypothetical protein